MYVYIYIYIYIYTFFFFEYIISYYIILYYTIFYYIKVLAPPRGRLPAGGRAAELRGSEAIPVRGSTAKMYTYTPII